MSIICWWREWRGKYPYHKLELICEVVTDWGYERLYQCKRCKRVMK